MSHCHCRDYTRSQLLRNGVAGAGAGLPDIEAGMPVPAGTGLTRRAFVARASGLALAVFGGSALAPRAFEEGIAAAAAQAPDAPVLVSVFLSGGLDSLTALAPVLDERYRTWRPGLAVTEADAPLPFGGDDRLYWHPSLAPLRDLYDAGKVTVVPSVGYDDPNQSHFTSRHYWEIGRLDPYGRVGWMGRYLDHHGSATNPLQGLALDYSLAPALAPDTNPVACVPDPERYAFSAEHVWDATVRSRLTEAFGGLGELPTSDPGLGAARAAARMTTKLAADLGPLQGTRTWTSSATYPQSHPFPRRLQVLAEMIDRGMPLRCVALTANGGYDTHANQEGSLPGDLALLAQSLAAFQADLEGRGVADRVLVHVWSEFGRRPRENGSGTDHGAGGASFLIGTRAAGGTVGEWRGLDDLHPDGNLRHSVDFRTVYRALLDQWLGVDPDPIVPGASTLPQLVA